MKRLMKASLYGYLLTNLCFHPAVLLGQGKPSVAATVEASCGNGFCHNGFAQPQFYDQQEGVLWQEIDANAARILARLSSESSPMPPSYAGADQQITDQARQDFIDYVKSQTDPVDDGGLPLNQLSVASGFKIELFAKVQGARSLAVASDGIVVVGTGGYSDVDPLGRVSAIIPLPNGKNQVVEIARGLQNPNGVALRGDDLYVAQPTRIIRFPGLLEVLRQTPAPEGRLNARFEVVYSGFPQQRTHSWKYLAFGPDDKLYVPVGAPCNVCEEDRDRYAAIFRMNPDGSDLELVAKGVRNTVGFTWHPETEELWFTDNGRDLLGDQVPPDELNRLTKIGEDFGFPYCHGKGIADPSFFRGGDCQAADFSEPVAALGAHVAALGLTFYTGKQFPDSYRNQLFIAEHGSWNASRKVGYRLSLVRLSARDNDQTVATSYEPFLDGWLNSANQSVWGRPVDVKNYPDGSLLLSDDQAGAIYRISYIGS